jgi:glycosyltransferase involved in cell wall biosynthesis
MSDIAKNTDWNSAQKILRPDGMLSIILPVYNLESQIRKNIEQIAQTFRPHIPFEIIAVNDGSHDETADALTGIEDAISELRVMNLAVNQGKGGALSKGFAASRGSHILFLDADLDLPPEQTSLFFEIMESSQADVVIGAKRHPDSVIDYPWHRKLVSSIYFRMVKLLLNLPLRDTQTGIKLFKREALEYALPRLLIKRFAFDLELLSVIHSCGFSITDAPVQLEFGEKLGCISPTTVYKTLIDTLAIFYRIRLLQYYRSFKIYPLPDPAPTTSVVIAFSTYNPYVFEMLEGLKRQTVPPAEIILLPDTASEHSFENNVREIPTGNQLPAVKRNLGIEAATGEIIAFLDDDTTPHFDWLETALSNFSETEITAVGGPGINAHNDTFMQKCGGAIYSSRLCSGPYRYRYVISRYRETDDYPSCNLLIRKTALQEIGGFSTNYWPGEDTVLCLDLIKRGGKIVYDPRAVVEHHRRALFIPHLRQLGRYAMHRGHFMKIFPETSLRPSYLLPSVFALAVLTGWSTCFFSPLLFQIYAGVLMLYFLVLIIDLFSVNPAKLILRVTGMFATHLVYGLGVLKGLLRGV